MNLCVDACHQLGDGLVMYLFTGVAFLWGYLQKQKLAAQKLETERYKQASLRPPAPLPVVHLQGAEAALRYASLFPPKPSGYEPAYESEIVGSIADTSPETPAAKEAK